MSKRGEPLVKGDDLGGSSGRGGVVPVEAVLAVVFCGFADGTKIRRGFGGRGVESLFGGWGGGEKTARGRAADGGVSGDSEDHGGAIGWGRPGLGLIVFGCCAEGSLPVIDRHSCFAKTVQIWLGHGFRGYDTDFTA